jgi:hypothetical protein
MILTVISLNFVLFLEMINLFFNYYKSAERQKEIDLCLKKNKEVFDRVIVFEGKHTFEKMFSFSENYPDDVNVFCNSDIYFLNTQYINNIKPNECYALTRWNKEGGNINFFNRKDSQDSWVFRGVVKNIKANFYTGMWGCDNRLLHEIQKAGYKTLNPSLSIITVHVHEKDNRVYDRTKENTVPPPYVRIDPCKI